MPDAGGDYQISISADVSGVASSFEELASSAESAGAAVTEGFSQAGPVIRDFATEMQQGAVSAEEFSSAMQAWAAGLDMAGASMATSAGELEALRAELDGTAEAAAAAAAEVAAAAEQEAAAIQAAAEAEVEAAGERTAAAEEAAAAQSAAMEKSVSGITSFSKALLPLIGVQMGASAFRSAVDGMMEFGDSMRITAAEMGVTLSQARGLNEGLASLGVSSSTATMAIRRLEMDAGNGGKALARLGVSVTDVNGDMKSGGAIFEEVINKLQNISTAGERSEAAFKLLGRGAQGLLAVLPEVGAAIASNTVHQEENDAANERASQISLSLHASLTQLKSVWDDIATTLMGPLSDGLKAVANYMEQMWDDTKKEIEVLSQLIEAIKSAAAYLQGMLANAFNAVTGAANATAQAITNVVSALGKMVGLAEPKGFSHLAEEGMGVGPDAGGGKAFGYGGEGGASDMMSSFLGSAHFAPKGGGGGGRGAKGGGGGADPMAGLNEQMDLSKQKMAELAKEFDKLGDESKMAAKEGGQSFQQLSQTAQQDYLAMQAKYKEFTDAVASGSKDAAKKFEADWKQATQQFQKDFDAAKQKAQQDMQQIKSTADQISSELSSVLNSAISGKVNWQQEFSKILSKMLDELIKHLAQQVALWATHHAQVLGMQASAGATGLAMQKTQNAAAGTSDAVTAAKGAYSSAAQIPYIGWIIAPFAAAAAFAGVEAFGSAAGGYEVPPGQNPMVRLHENELVLPSNISHGMKQMIAGGQYGGGGNTANVNMHIQSLDPSKLGDIVSANPDLFANAVGRYIRGGGPVYTG